MQSSFLFLLSQLCIISSVSKTHLKVQYQKTNQVEIMPLFWVLSLCRPNPAKTLCMSLIFTLWQ